MHAVRAAGTALVLAALVDVDTAFSAEQALVTWQVDPSPPDADALPPGAVARLGSAQFKRPDPIRSVAVSADGRTVVSASYFAFSVWDVASGREKCRYRTTARATIAVAAGGDVLVAANNTAEVLLIELATGRPAAIPLPAPETFAEVAITPDGAIVAAASERPRKGPGQPARATDLVVVCDVRGKRVLREQRLDGEGALKVALSPDGKRLAAARSDGTVHLCELATGHATRVSPAGLPKDVAAGPAFSPSGQAVGLNTGSGETILLDPASGEERSRVRSLAQAGSAVAFSADGELFAVADDEGAGLYKAAGGLPVNTLHEPGNSTFAVAFSRDGKTLVTGGDDGRVRLWDLASRRQRPAPVGHTRAARALAFAPDGRALASVDGGGSLYVWDLADGRRARRLATGSSLAYLAFAPDGRRLASKRGLGFAVWDKDAGGATDAPAAQAADAGGAPLGFTRGGRLLVTAEGPDIVWRAADNLSVEKRFPGALAGARLFTVTPRPGGVLVAVMTRPGAFGVLDEAGREVGRLDRVPVVAARGLVASADGRRLAIRDDRQCVLWDLGSGAPAQFWDVGDVWWQDALAAFSPDGRLLAGRNRQWDVCVFETASGRVVLRFPGEASHEGAMTFSPDGRTLATAEDAGPIVLWHLTGTPAVPRRAAPPAADLPGAWDDLLGDNATRAFRAVWRLADSPSRAVPFLRERLKPAEPVPAGTLREMVTALDDRRFAARQAAFRALCDAAERAEAEIRRAARGSDSAEAGAALGRVIEALERQRLRPAGERLRELRAVQALEYMRTPESRALLERLAHGVPGATLTREARAALERLAR